MGGGDPWGGAGEVGQESGQAWGQQPPQQGQIESSDPFSPPAQAGHANGNSPDLMAAFGGSQQQAPNSSANQGASPMPAPSGNPWDLSGLDPLGGGGLKGQGEAQIMNNGTKQKNSVESMLGEHSNLINLDNLVQVKSSAATGAVPKNPFADQPNPFQAAAAPKPTINQLRTAGQPSTNSPWPESQPRQAEADINPFF